MWAEDRILNMGQGEREETWDGKYVVSYLTCQGLLSFGNGYQRLHEPRGMNMHVSVLVTIYKSSAAKVCSFHQILKRFPDLQMFADA